MNFPSSPSLGTTLDLGNGLIWTWNGNAWDLTTNFNQVVAVFWPLVGYVQVVAEQLLDDGAFTSDNSTGFALVDYV